MDGRDMGTDAASPPKQRPRRPGFPGQRQGVAGVRGSVGCIPAAQRYGKGAAKIGWRRDAKVTLA
jgi:hypothetical protein